MTEMSRKYWALAVITVAVVGLSYAVVVFAEQLADRAKQRHVQWGGKAKVRRAIANASQPGQ